MTLTGMALAACVPPGSDGQGPEGFEEAIAAVTGRGVTPIPPPAPRGCLRRVDAGTHRFGRCAGANFTVTIPQRCTTSACGLILDVHGWTMDANSQDAATGMRARVRATQDFVLIQPSARGRSWGGAEDRDILAFVDLVVDVFSIDQDRVHMMGFSQGGFMTWRMLCARPTFFASVAPLGAGGPSCFGVGERNPEVPILQVHGYSDQIVPYSSARESRVDIIEAMQSDHTEVVVADERSYRWKRHTGRGLHYELIGHSYSKVWIAGHCIPGGGGIFGCAPGSLDVGEEVYRFFEDHPRGIPSSNPPSSNPPASNPPPSNPPPSNPPPVTDYAAPGPFAVAVERGGPRGAHTVFRPDQLGANGVRHPVLVWGNGTGATPRVYAALLQHFASHGFIVVAANSTQVFSGARLIEGLDWIEAENARTGGAFFDKVDLGSVGALGHSQGGGGAINAGGDPRVDTVIAIQPAPASPRALRGTLLALAGGRDALVLPVWVRNFVYAPSPVPTVYGLLQAATHFEPVGDGGAMRGYMTAWLRWQLMNDATAEQEFRGSSCAICTDSAWRVERKNI